MFELADKFLTSFNNIEAFLKDKYGKSNEYETFSSLLVRGSEKSLLIRSNEKRLKKLADLRNAIAHTSRDEVEVLAIPHQKTLENIQDIERKILNPKKVQDFKKKFESVIVVDLNDTLQVAVDLMSKKEVSQLVVESDGKFINVLSSQSIARWLGATQQDFVQDLMLSKVDEILKFREQSEKFELVARSTTYIDVIGIFDKASREGKTISAVLVSENGKMTDKILNVVTSFDLPDFYKEI